jgi:hypothetical protein
LALDPPPSSWKARRPMPEGNAAEGQAMRTGARLGPGTAGRNETRPGFVTPRCRVCGTLVTVAVTGRPRAYCSQACRTRAWRAQHQAAPRDSQDIGGAPGSG